jgi:hypothetical protein
VRGAQFEGQTGRTSDLVSKIVFRGSSKVSKGMHSNGRREGEGTVGKEQAGVMSGKRLIEESEGEAKVKGQVNLDESGKWNVEANEK